MSSSKLTPFDQNQVAAYERKRYRGLDQRLVHWQETKIVGQLLEEVAPAEKGATFCLDAPCGYGRFSSLILEKGFRLISADLSLAMVKRACLKGYNYSYPMGIVCNITSVLPFLSSAFEVVLCLRFFHHLHSAEERRAVLKEFYRLTKGRVIISFYKRQFLHRLARALRRLVRPSPTQISMLPLSLFRQEVEEAGFEIRRLVPLCRGLHAQYFALLKKKD